MIQEITNIKQKQELKNEFLKVFKRIDPFSEIFKETIKERLILYPTNGYYLTNEQLEALIKAAIVVGDSKINISEVESESNCFTVSELDDSEQRKHWVVENPNEICQYNQLLLVLENSIYSPQGKWGLIVSHEDHAVLGGTSEFIESFKANYNKCDEDIKAFEENWGA